MRINARRHAAIAALCAALWPFGAGSTIASEGADQNVHEELVVGVIDAPSLATKSPAGQWEGPVIDVVRTIARDTNRPLSLREYDSFSELVDAVTRDEIDLVATVAVTREREDRVDFSNAYAHSGSAIAVPAGPGGRSWLGVLRGLLSLRFLSVVGALVLLWLMVGTAVWLFESRANTQMFGRNLVRGIGHGIWWAAVTMTTVGYGDKAPATLGGRLVAVLWMFASVICISSFTAAITTSLTVGELGGRVRGFRDLPHVRVGSPAGSATRTELAEKGVFTLPFEDPRQGLQAVADGRIDAFVSDGTMLQYLLSAEFPGQLRLLPDRFDSYFVAMAFPPGASIRETVNRALLSSAELGGWSEDEVGSTRP